MRSGAPDPVATVAAGYDRLAAEYDEWAGQIVDDHRDRLLDRLERDVGRGTAVLELGAGTGGLAARLADRYDYLGVDLSPAMVDRARQAVPAAEFRVADMRTLDFPPGSFGAVVAFYSIIHVPRNDRPALFASIRRWLRPGGVFVAALHAGDDPAGVEDDWLAPARCTGAASTPPPTGACSGRRASSWWRRRCARCRSRSARCSSFT